MLPNVPSNLLQGCFQPFPHSHWIPEGRAQYLTLHYPSSGSYREWWGHSSASFSLNKTNSKPSAAALRAFPPLLCCPPLDTLNNFHTLLKLQGSELATVLQVMPHQHWIEQDNHLFCTAGQAVFEAPQNGFYPFGSLLTHAKPASHQHLTVLTSQLGRERSAQAMALTCVCALREKALNSARYFVVSITKTEIDFFSQFPYYLIFLAFL